MINLSLRTEYSFRKTFGKLDDVIKHAKDGVVGIADLNCSIAHVKFEKICKKNNIKPIFGVRVFVVKDKDIRDRSPGGCWYTLIAKNEDGFKEMNLVTQSAWDNFYYSARVALKSIKDLSADVFVIASNFWDPERIDYIGLSPETPMMIAQYPLPKVAIQENYYSSPEDRTVYQCLAGGAKRGDSFNFKFDDSRRPMHILSEAEYKSLLDFPMDIKLEAIQNTYAIAEQVSVSIPVAPMVRYYDKKANIRGLALEGARAKGIELVGEYLERLEREISVIEEKDFQDYFLIVSDILKFAKKRMLVGPARGSSAGSLLCYLLDITTVDPLIHGLMFERFVDLNRPDLPDIDVDFPDDKRDMVIDYIVARYGKKNTCHIMNVNTMRAKSAIGDFAAMLSIPKWETDAVKEVIVDRTGGDARAKMAVEDTLNTTAIGKAYLEKYPIMNNVFVAEGHATHYGKHAAGIIICNTELSNYAAINSRETSLMMTKKEIEDKNLLKFDCLGLRTMSILSEAASLAGLSYDDVYNIPLDDEATFKVFGDNRLSGIFQYEGKAMAILSKQMPIEKFDDVVAITALARPGPLHSGAAGKFAKSRSGEELVEYMSSNPLFIDVTKDTQGVIIYQEQLMQLARVLGSMSWDDVTEIRKASSKTLGKHHFDKYEEKFVKGAIGNGMSKPEATKIWSTMVTFGSWGMNKAHAVSYGYISYWCAWFKAHHPLEFAIASLNRARGDDSIVKLLRDITEQDGIPYVAVDPDISTESWSHQDGILYGPLTGIDGIAYKTACSIVKWRNGKGAITPSMAKKLLNPTTGYDTLYPCRDFWGKIYDNPSEYGLNCNITLIKNAEEIGEYVVIGKVKNKDLRDLNEYNEMVKRGGIRWEENNKELKLYVEDDTDAISCKINRFAFDKLGGSSLYESLIENKTWVLIKGRIRSEWRSITIDNIFDLTGFEV